MGSLNEPLLQDHQIMGIHILKADADSLSWVSVDYNAVGFEEFSIRVDFQKDCSAFFERIGHFHEAAVEAQLE